MLLASCIQDETIIRHVKTQLRIRKRGCFLQEEASSEHDNPRHICFSNVAGKNC